MKFLVDAQLPRHLSHWLKQRGHDSLHTLDLPDGNRTSDLEVMRVADTEERIVITKDEDFVQSHLLRGEPKKLLLISTGNIRNDDLLSLFEICLPTVIAALEAERFIELTPIDIIVH